MNNKAQVVFFSFMLTLTIVILALSLAYPVKQGADNASASSEMNCTSQTDKFIKASCYVTDISPAYFVGGLLAIAGVVLGAKFLGGFNE